MNAEQLNAWAGRKASGTDKGPLVRQLVTGTMPAGQGSSIAPVNITPDEAVNLNAVPFVEGGYPAHIAPSGTPGRQHLTIPPTAQVPPWIQVPRCALGKVPVRSAPIGVVGDSGAMINLPSKSVVTRAPRVFATTY
jgi:hypothetical protein